MITNRHNNCILQPESMHRGGGKMLCELKQS